MTTVRGSSGVAHEFLAMGTDQDRGRIVLISEAPDARSAALAQADIQAALPDLKVIVVRPILLSVSRTIELITEQVGSATVTSEFIASLPNAATGATQEEVNEAWLPVLSPSLDELFRNIQTARGMQAFSVRPHLVEALAQFSKVKFRGDSDSFSIDFSALVGGVGTESDVQLGICGLPVYEMTSEEWETINSGTDRGRDRDDSVRARDSGVLLSASGQHGTRLYRPRSHLARGCGTRRGIAGSGPPLRCPRPASVRYATDGYG